MNRDGSLDMVFPTCFSVSKVTGIGSDCSINIVYNQQKKLCQGSSSIFEGSGCRSVDNLCEADDDFKFEFDPTNNEVPLLIQGFTFSDGIEGNDSFSPPRPIPWDQVTRFTPLRQDILTSRTPSDKTRRY